MTGYRVAVELLYIDYYITVTCSFLNLRQNKKLLVFVCLGSFDLYCLADY